MSLYLPTCLPIPDVEFCIFSRTFIRSTSCEVVQRYELLCGAKYMQHTMSELLLVGE